MTEYERRRRAVEALQAGATPTEIGSRLGRSRAWVYTTKARYQSGGLAALNDRSRAPHLSPQETAPGMVKRILAVRRRLMKPGRNRGFSGVGADVIAWELHLAGCKDIPAPRTIERIVARAGLTGRARPRRTHKDPRPYPAPTARQAGDVQQSDIVGPRHIATRKGPLRLFSYSTVDVCGGGIACWQSPERSAAAYCTYLVEHAWARLGVPRVWQVDNEMVLAGFPRRPQAFTAPVRLALLLGAEVCFIPQGEPGRQAHVESFNALWQERVLRRFRFSTLSSLRAKSERFERWFMEERPHPQLRAKDHGTLYPAVLLASMDGHIRRLPKGFSLEPFREPDGRLKIPLARGRVTWIRLVSENGGIDIGGKRFPVGARYANQYVTATLSTSRRTVTVKLGARVVKRFPFPLTERVVQPVLQR